MYLLPASLKNLYLLHLDPTPTSWLTARYGLMCESEIQSLVPFVGRSCEIVVAVLLAHGIPLLRSASASNCQYTFAGDCLTDCTHLLTVT